MDEVKIAKLCNEIEDIACDISQQTMYDIISAESRMIFDKAKDIFAEITAPPKSNGDRIRKMTDDEELLSAIGTGCYRCAYNNGECDSRYGEGCIAGNLEWLKQEVETDDKR